MSIVQLGKLSNVEALVALFNNAKPLGLGKLQYNPLRKLDRVEASLVLLQNDYVDYLEGRVIKTRFPLKATEIDCTLYDRDNGEGSAERAIKEYERAHYLERETESLDIPESFGGSRCTIVKDISYGNVYKFNVMGGELSVHQDIDYVNNQHETIFRFKVNDIYVAVKYEDYYIDKSTFIQCARETIIKYVKQLK